jgi:hypothetical protein
MNLNDDIVYRCVRLGPINQRHPGRSRSLIRHHNRFHLGTSLDHSSPAPRTALPTGLTRRLMTSEPHAASAQICR